MSRRKIVTCKICFAVNPLNGPGNYRYKVHSHEMDSEFNEQVLIVNYMLYVFQYWLSFELHISPYFRHAHYSIVNVIIHYRYSEHIYFKLADLLQFSKLWFKRFKLYKLKKYNVLSLNITGK